ncbi:MAG: SUF system NifU family Fe-S cluster assembly protein [Bacilli bacterium]|nr:SUF system NifU family Fe-S cluster assembly protein [Bacilli bacterium]
MDRDIKRAIIMDNYKDNDNRKRHDKDNKYVMFNTRSATCIDNLDIYLNINNNIIEDISFDGEACVISTSSTNIMINLLKGKTVDEAIKIISNYDNMIKEKDYDKEVLGEAICYDDICKQPNRIKCATLSWDGLYKELIKYKNNEK